MGWQAGSLGEFALARLPALAAPFAFTAMDSAEALGGQGVELSDEEAMVARRRVEPVRGQYPDQIVLQGASS